LFDDTDAASFAPNAVGSLGALETLPPFVAIPFTLLGENPAVKNGAKRIVGVPEGPTSDGILDGAGYIGDCEALGDGMAAAITAGAVIPTDTWAPTIVKRVRSGTAGDYEYRLPENIGETVLSRIAGTLLDLVLSSQVSRKFGRGA
jgi:hypothetical protein